MCHQQPAEGPPQTVSYGTIDDETITRTCCFVGRRDGALKVHGMHSQAVVARKAVGPMGAGSTTAGLTTSNSLLCHGASATDTGFALAEGLIVCLKAQARRLDLTQQAGSPV